MPGAENSCRVHPPHLMAKWPKGKMFKSTFYFMHSNSNSWIFQVSGNCKKHWRKLKQSKEVYKCNKYKAANLGIKNNFLYKDHFLLSVQKKKLLLFLQSQRKVINPYLLWRRESLVSINQSHPKKGKSKIISVIPLISHSHRSIRINKMGIILLSYSKINFIALQIR